MSAYYIDSGGEKGLGVLCNGVGLNYRTLCKIRYNKFCMTQNNNKWIDMKKMSV